MELNEPSSLTGPPLDVRKCTLTPSSGQPTRTVTVGYDADGLPTSTQYPGGNVVAATYNPRGLPGTIGLDGSVLATYAFNPVRLFVRKTLENGTETHYTYDVVNQLTAIEHRRGTDLIQRAGYAFDVVGNRVNKTTSSVAGGGAGLAEAYDYDAVDQVVRARYGTSRDVVYGYDAVGNRQSVNDSGTVVGYTANSDNAYTAVGGIALSRDGNGNQVETPGGQYLYDAQNRAVRAEVGGQVTTFVYDARNRVVQRTTDGVTTHLTYEGWNLIEERDATGLLTQVYVHGAGTDELLSKINATGAVYYHADALGSTLALTDATGIAVESYAYDVFGSVTVRNSSGIAVPISTVGNRFAFTGREWIAAAAFYDYRNRIYSPQLGRFLQTDPIRFAAGDVNIYRYCGNNPVNWVDPFGQSPSIPELLGLGFNPNIPIDKLAEKDLCDLKYQRGQAAKGMARHEENLKKTDISDKFRKNQEKGLKIQQSRYDALSKALDRAVFNQRQTSNAGKIPGYELGRNPRTGQMEPRQSGLSPGQRANRPFGGK